MAKEGLYKKLAEVLAEVERIRKNGHNQHFNYDYVLEADLVDCIRPILAKKKLVILPSVEEATKDNNISSVKMRFRFVDAESGDFEDVIFIGQGQDASDKGYYKAYTGAVKYCLMKTFLVATGDDPEMDDEIKPITTAIDEGHVPAPNKDFKASTNGTIRSSANASKPASNANLKGFWTSVKNLGLSENVVHQEAASFFNIPGLQSLNDVPGLDAGKLNKFLSHLISLKNAGTVKYT